MNATFHTLTARAKSLLDARFARYVLTGALNTAFGYSIFFALLRLTGREIVALTLGTIIGVIFNFVSLGRIVFRSSDQRRLLKFIACYAIVYAYNAIGLLALGARGVDPAIGGLLLLPGAVAISWTLNSRFVFSGEPDDRVGLIGN